MNVEQEAIALGLHYCTKHNIGFINKCSLCEVENYEPPKPTPEYIERERHLERIVEDMHDRQLLAFALWEIHAATEGTSDVVSAELLKRSGVSESLAKW